MRYPCILNCLYDMGIIHHQVFYGCRINDQFRFFTDQDGRGVDVEFWLSVAMVATFGLSTGLSVSYPNLKVGVIDKQVVTGFLSNNYVFESVSILKGKFAFIFFHIFKSQFD